MHIRNPRFRVEEIPKAQFAVPDEVNATVPSAVRHC